MHHYYILGHTEPFLGNSAMKFYWGAVICGSVTGGVIAPLLGVG